MNKGLLIAAALSLISAVVQLLVVLSVPITGPDIGYDLALARYNELAFGVFGICNYNTHSCTKPKIGYSSLDALVENENGGVQLPSDARYSISKLLVVHVVAFALSGVLNVVTFTYLIILWMRERQLDKISAQRQTELDDLDNADKTSDITHTNTLNNDSSHQSGTGTMGSVSGASSRSQYRHTSFKSDTESFDSGGSRGIKRVDLTPFLDFQLIFSLISCLFTLLGLLSDILLFVPHLSYLGWMQVIPITFLAVEATLICFIKRSVLSRRHLDEEYYYANDDMRTHTRLDVIEDDDDGSDDGFYVYTNGFYSNYGDREEHNQSQQSNSNSWRRHTPHNDNEEESINSEQLNRERTQLREWTRSN